MKSRKYIWFIIALFAVISCEYDFPEDKVYSDKDFGKIDVNNFIVTGDGYLAGLMDGALYTAGQKNSIAGILAAQFSIINEQTFNQPDIASENGYNLYVPAGNNISGKWIYKYENNTDENPKLVLTTGEAVKDYPGEKNDLNNLAIPQLNVNQLTDSELDENPFYSRIFLGNGETIIEQVRQKNPTFLLSWLGINDYLNYAMQGANNPENLTSVEDFQHNYQLFIEELIENTQSKIAIGNLISIEDLPFFYTRQYDFIRLEGSKLSAAMARYSEFNKAVARHNINVPSDQKRPFISYYDNGATLYPQPVVVIDETLSDAYYPDGRELEKFRQLTGDEMALFSITDEMVENGMGWIIPLDKRYYLTAQEREDINERTNAFNQVLVNLSQIYPDRLLLVDIADPVKKIADTGKYDSWGFVVSEEIVYEEGVPLEGDLGMNSIFSLDAVHFNQRGNAYITNQFIQEINNSFRANIPFAKVNSYIGNAYIY